MNLLAIECSVSHASLCLAGEVSFSADWVAERNHDAYLFPALQEALRVLGDARALHAILVGAGPGSYGGVRVALAAATGVAMVRHSHVVALDSWESLAQGRACILSDAKRGGWALRRPNGQIEVQDTQSVLQALSEGALIWSVESAESLARAEISLPRCGLVPKAQGLIDTWLSLGAEEQAARAALPAEPIYVRPPHITTPKRKPWEIAT